MIPSARRLGALALSAPLALALASCGDKAATDPATTESPAVQPVSAPAGTTWRETVTVTPDGGHLVGNPNAPIKLVEYGSLTCPTLPGFAFQGMEGRPSK